VIINVRLFAGLRERAQTSEIEVDLPEGSTAAELLVALADIVDDTRCVVAVNRQYTGPDTVLRAGDEVALVPPVSGGAPVVSVGPEAIDLSAIAAQVASPRAGATVTFTGMTRDVESLEYEAYQQMAIERITQICDEVAADYGLIAIAAAHRTGTVPLGGASVVIAASAAHRPEAFAGAREAIDRIKAEAPIWKVEIDGADRRRVEGQLPPSS